LGHARTFWIAHQRARAAQGTLWLRDEDLDRQRARPEFSAAMKEDLRWLGIDWDAELRQSDRLPLYRAALERLLAAGLAYPCTCSRRDLQASIQAPHEDEDDEPIYNNRCRPGNDRCWPTSSIQDLSSRPKAEPERRAGSPTSALCSVGCRDLHLGSPPIFSPNTNYRFRIPTAGPLHFTDLAAGAQTFTPTLDFGDFVIWRKDGLPSYQLACVVDDAAMGITEVVRGRDLLKSTARQILLQRALGLPTPQYFHTDLLRDEHGVRLAKRHDALALRTLRERGLGPADVRALF